MQHFWPMSHENGSNHPLEVASRVKDLDSERCRQEIAEIGSHSLFYSKNFL